MYGKREKEKSNLVRPSVRLSCRTVPISITNGAIAPSVVRFEPQEILQVHYVAWRYFDDGCYMNSFYDPMGFVIKKNTEGTLIGVEKSSLWEKG